MISIVTDSTCDLPTHLVARYGIRVVPTILILEGQSLRDGEDINRDEFYRRLPALNPPPTTAAPSTGEFEAPYQELLDRGANHVLSIHLSSKLSGVFNAARLAAGAFPGRVTVEDSGQLSMGLGFQVLAAAGAARRGADLPGVLSAARAVRERVRLFAMLDTLKFLRRSGRVNFLRASLGHVLQIKLLVELAGGEVIRLGQTRTRKTAIRSLMECARAMGRLSRLAVLHTGAPDDAAALSADLAGQSAEAPIIVTATTIIGTHVGPRALGVVAVAA